MARKTIKKLEDQITSLKLEKETLSTQVTQLNDSLKQERENFKNEKDKLAKEKDEILNQKINELNTRIKSLDQEIEKLKNEVNEKQKQIDRRELKKFAEAYESQEDQCNRNSSKWFKYVIGAFVLVIVATMFIVHGAQDATLSQKIGYYFVDIVLITFLFFH